MNRDKIIEILNRLTEHKATEYIIGLYTDEILASGDERRCPDCNSTEIVNRCLICGYQWLDSA